MASNISYLHGKMDNFTPSLRCGILHLELRILNAMAFNYSYGSCYTNMQTVVIVFIVQFRQRVSKLLQKCCTLVTYRSGSMFNAVVFHFNSK